MLMTISPSGLEGAPNFRDLGGFRAVGGSHVRPGRLFRSESLERLTDGDLAQIASLDIALVYDLRNADERTRASNRWPLGKALETVAGIDSPQLEAVSVFDWRERIADPTFDAAAALHWMQDAYAKMPGLFAGVLASAFDRLGAPAAPATLIHCTAGKDRTGFISAVVLLALGVSRDEVFEDYLLTRNRRSPEALLHMLGPDLTRQSPTTRAAMLTIADVREGYLGAALHAIERDFCSMEAYLALACGLDSARSRRLRLKLLE
ncbi:tyrosine-protein phosphatase [Paraburkholderia sp. SIMBA_030]|uniref:tyrosine-protein phosphatase n=1 Tax=Paraburkholderia sp. SIMBA_030 TaxID=3085773 RepID=UPI00397B96E6